VNRRAARWGPVAVYVLIIFGLSSLHHPPRPLAMRAQDKIWHLLEYGGLGLVTLRALRGGGRRLAVAGGVAIGFGALLGIADELYQSTVPGRYSTVSDVVADVCGVALAWGLRALWERRARPT